MILRLFYFHAVAASDYGDCDCSFVAILSHGDTDVVDGKDGSVRIDQLLAPFKQSTRLSGKPKIFLFQVGQNAYAYIYNGYIKNTINTD